MLREAVELDPDYGYRRSALARTPHQPEVDNHLGMAYAQLGRFTEAHQHFDRAEELAPLGGMSVSYGWYRTFALGFEERYPVAVRLLEELLHNLSRYPSPRIMLGLYVDALARHDGARDRARISTRNTLGPRAVGCGTIRSRVLAALHREPLSPGSTRSRRRRSKPVLTSRKSSQLRDSSGSTRQ